jgi:phthalate 4,5-cis-dihydrodiol dehydrogenase
VIFSQAAHQVDVVRLLGGGQVLSVYGCTGQWDQNRKTEGAYSALLTFDRGLFASITYNGYGGYDSDADMNWRGELGGAKSPDAHQITRQRYSQYTDETMEAQRKSDRNFGGPDYVPASVSGAQTFQHFGPVLVTCERADLRLTPYGVDVYSLDGKVTCHPECSVIPRVEVMDEIWSVAREGGQVLHSGEWALATLEVCLGILASAQTSMPVLMHHQIQNP